MTVTLRRLFFAHQVAELDLDRGALGTIDLVAPDKRCTRSRRQHRCSVNKLPFTGWDAERRLSAIG
ncbi:hypothetical protein ACFYXM_26170 [Streptomyces sp. NPDC002476]|uniref:hypothetical protein n=1 Tax=Streptomyces sp. NPDC002476 TaxID=3364648 RepID=UPI0036863FD3